MEYAPFQGLPKSRARKKDKSVGTIESEQHFINFLESLKTEELENQKTEPKLEYSYQIKDDKKITSTPLLEFIANKIQEKRDVKKKKRDEQRKKQDEKKAEKKLLVAKNIPEPIKESKEEIVYDDGVMVRTVPSRLGRDRGSGRKEKVDSKPEKSERDEKDKLKHVEERKMRRKLRKEKKSNTIFDRDQRRKEKHEAEKAVRISEKAENSIADKPKDKAQSSSTPAVEQKEVSANKKEPVEKSDQPPAKREVKRYSELRKARQEQEKHASEVKAPTDEFQKPSEVTAQNEPSKSDVTDHCKIADPLLDRSKEEARAKRVQELRERRAREDDERAQRRIKNKDRPAMQIYQPKRRTNDGEQASSAATRNERSSDENSDTSRKRSDSDSKIDRRERKFDKKTRRGSKDESYRKKKSSSRKNSDSGDGAGEKSTGSGDGTKTDPQIEPINEKMDPHSLGGYSNGQMPLYQDSEEE